MLANFLLIVIKNKAWKKRWLALGLDKTKTEFRFYDFKLRSVLQVTWYLCLFPYIL